MNDIDLIKSKLLDYNCSDSYVFLAIDTIESKMKLLEKLQETLYSAELYLVYKHTAPNGKVYIGITKNLPNARWNEGAGYETQKKFYKAIQTFGWINFKHEIIAAGLSEKEAKELESKLIIEYKSNEEEYGYNVQVLRNLHKSANSNNTSQVTMSGVTCTDIANMLIKKFSIKTVGGKIFYLKDDKYVLEKYYPIIKKELLLTHHIETRKQKEIIEQIKILSYTKKHEIFPDISAQESENWNKHNTDISSFFESLVLDKNINYFISDEELYEKFISWKMLIGGNLIDKDNFFKRSLLWMEKYRPDTFRVHTKAKSGWELRAIIDNKTEKKLTTKGIDDLHEWLDITKEPIICVPMICEEVFGIRSKVSKKISNEICFALRKNIPCWKDIGVKRIKKYGSQRCFVKDETSF